MKIYTQDDVDNYMKNDWILEEIKKNECNEEKEIRTHQWMLQMENKRAIYADVYGDILRVNEKRRKRVLDVGGYQRIDKTAGSKFSIYIS